MRLGYSIPIEKDLYYTLKENVHKDAKCFQTFLKDYIVDSQQKINILKHCLETEQTLYLHLPLNINLARESSDYRINYYKNLIDKNMRAIEMLPAAGVLHIGNYLKRDEAEAYNGVINQLNNLKLHCNNYSNVPKCLLLENSAGQGTSMGKTWDQLRKIFEGLNNNNIGLCIDTAHGFGSGICKFQTHDDIVKLFDNAENVCGKNPINLIHLNDSKVPFDSRKDRHQNICQGYIWNNEDHQEGLKSLLQRCKEDKIDMILETPSENILNDFNYILDLNC